jgi:flagellar protein FlaG
MGMEIPNKLGAGQHIPPELHFSEKPIPAPAALEAKSGEYARPILPKVDIDKAMQALVKAASIFNKRLKYFINEDTGMVVVKVVDEETDKVIKEIPSPEIQRLAANLKETIGLLVDEKI